jgi:hypothetical protein
MNLKDFIIYEKYQFGMIFDIFYRNIKIILSIYDIEVGSAVLSTIK